MEGLVWSRRSDVRPELVDEASDAFMVPTLGLCILHDVEVVDTYGRPGEVGPEAPCAIPLRALGAGGLIELAVAILASSLFVFLLLFLVPFPFHSLLAFEAKLVFGEAGLGRPLSPRCVHALWALVGGSRCRVEVATANAAV